MAKDLSVQLWIYYKIIPQGKVDDNLGPDRLTDQKAPLYIPTITDNEPFDCTIFVLSELVISCACFWPRYSLYPYFLFCTSYNVFSSDVFWAEN